MTVGRGVHDPRIAAAPAVIVVHDLVAAAPREQEVGVEIVRYQIDCERLIHLHRQNPALKVGRVARQLRIVGRERAGDRLSHVDHTGHATEAAAHAIAGSRRVAVGDRQPVVAELRLRAGIRIDAIIAGGRRHERQPRVAVLAAVVVERQPVSRRISEHQIRVEVVRGQVDVDRVTLGAEEPIQLVVRAVGKLRVGLDEAVSNGLPHAKCPGLRGKGHGSGGGGGERGEQGT